MKPPPHPTAITDGDGGAEPVTELLEQWASLDPSRDWPRRWRALRFFPHKYRVSVSLINVIGTQAVVSVAEKTLERCVI
jgi:hypothetical protein